jgi:hypothetical protein
MARDDDKRVKLEMESMATIYAALQKLDSAGQRWVLRCVMDRLGIDVGGRFEREPDRSADEPQVTIAPIASTPVAPTGTSEPSVSTDGISPVASKWMVRNGLTAASLSSLYSLGLDEIDLVARDVPGTSKKDRMRSVLLLKGIASYLSTGVARVTDEKIREACIHYDAFDRPNFAKHLRDFAREVGGTRESGYTLTAAGLAAATDIIKDLVLGDGAAPKSTERKRKRGSSRVD